MPLLRRAPLTLVALLSFTATACATGTATQSGPERTPVIISTDLAMGLTSGNANGAQTTPPDPDDAWAYALAASSDSLDIRGVVVTMGNSQVSAEMTAAQQTAAALNDDAPLRQGASVWLPAAPIDLVDDGSLDSACINEGVEFMRDELQATDGVVILAIGPMTDIACLTLNFPEAAQRIAEVVSLSGGAPGPLLYDGKEVRDFNFVMDPRAAQVILEQTDIPFTAVMLGASSSGAVPIDRILDLADSADDRAAYFGRASTPYATFWSGLGYDSKPLWDAAAVWFVLHPEDFTCETAGFDLTLGPPDAPLGQTYDWYSPEYTDTRQVRACNSFASDDAVTRYIDTTLRAVGG